MERLGWLLAPRLTQITFALRLCIAIALALYVSMWLELDRPYWAALEVAVMMQPVPGAVVLRGFARAAGTVVAGCVGLFIMALFAQSYELSALSLAIWVGLCAFGANLLRNNLSYGFAIAGFLAGITVVLSHALNQPPFEIAVARSTECILAALITAVVNVLFSPPHGVRRYLNSRLDLLRSLGRELTQLMATFTGNDTSPTDPDRDSHEALQALVTQTLALEQTRQYVRYEAPEFAAFNRLARRFDYEVLSLISSTSSLHAYLIHCDDAVDTRALVALAKPAQKLLEEPGNPQAVKSAFDQAYQAILDMAREPADHGKSRSLADWVIISRTLGIISRCRSVIVTHELLISERQRPARRAPKRSEFSRPMDFRNAARNSIRAFCAVGAGGVVWVNFHDQLPAMILMILLSALTTILPTLTPKPAAAARLFARGLAFAAVGAFVIDFLIVPMAYSFAMLMLGMLPFVFVAGLAMSNPNPATAVPGRISVLMISLLIHTQNYAIPDFLTFAQMVMGIAGAITVTILVFNLILPISPRQRLREQMAGVFKELAHAMGHSRRERFETRMYDRLNTLMLMDNAPSTQTSARRGVLATIVIGLEARSLVVVTRRMALSPALKENIHHEIHALQSLLASRALPTDAQVTARSTALHNLAGELASALERSHEAERRLGIRAAICAELISSALQDYIASLHLGETSRTSGGQRKHATNTT